MRLFTGIPIDPGVLESLSVAVHSLRTKAKLNWSPPENYHITTKFLGECAEENFNSVVAALDRVPRPWRFEISVEGLGFFPNPRLARVFWAGIAAPEQLARLVSDTESALRPLGFEPETRAYSPHLTLARVKPGQSAMPITEDVALHAATIFGSFTVREFYLYRSRPGRGESVYERLHRFLLE